MAPMTSSSDFSRPGAVDLSGLRPVPAGGGPGGPGAYVVDVDEQAFQTEVLEASLDHVVVLSLWSPRAPASIRQNELLSALADEMAGRFLLALVDVDANQQIAAAIGAQGVPFVLGLVRGQPVPLFQGTVDEADARRYLDELLKVAAANGVTGRATPRAVVGPDEPDEPVDDPRFAVGDQALAAGDLDGAIAAYEHLVAVSPADEEAAERLAAVRLAARAQGADPEAVRAAATSAPDDIAAQLLAADVDVLEGHTEAAFDRLLRLVARSVGPERDEVRKRLLELFSVVGTDDPQVADARRRLASALF